MNPDPETYTLIDFDNAEYGYRAWDFSYYFTHWGHWPTIEQQRLFFNKLLYKLLFIDLKEMGKGHHERQSREIFSSPDRPADFCPEI